MGPMVGERWDIGVEADREVDVLPDQLDHATAAATEIHDPGVWSEVGPHQRLELFTARAPTGPHGSIAGPV